MTPFFRNFVAGLAATATLFVAACGGGGGGDTPAAASPTAVARATPASAPVGSTVTLDGSASTTPNGGTLSYQWSLTSKPDGSAATLSSPSAAQPTLTLDQPGSYVADLVVNDGKASSTAARVTVTATNPDPVAVIANASQTVLLGSTVALDGSGSLPPTGASASDLTYQWRLTEQPSGDPATTLTNATRAQASFTAQKTGIYKVTLVASHGGRSSAAAQAEIKVNTGNTAPVAGAKVLVGGAEVAATTASNGNLSTTGTIAKGQTITLDGRSSSDPDGDTLSYRWSFPPYVANSTNPPKPYASQAVIKNATSAQAEFVADAVGLYYLDLVVYDRSVAITKRVIVNVTKPAGAANTAPNAVIFVQPEYELGAWVYPGGSRSNDAEGDALTYKWTWWNTATPGNKTVVPPGTGINGAGLNDLGNKAPAGTYHVQLVVSDGQLDSAPADAEFIIKIGANVNPVSRVVVERGTVQVGETITFDGSGSTDKNGDQIFYQWTLTDRPDGSTAVLQNATTAKASVVPDKPGRYSAYLVTSDAKGSAPNNSAVPTAYASVFAKSENNAPVAANFKVWGTIPTADQPLVMRTFVGTDGNSYTGAYVNFQADIFDPDLDNPLYYILTATKFPPGSPFTKSVSGQTFSSTAYATTINDPASDSGNGYSFPLTLPGEHAFQLLVSDGVAYSDTQTLNFNVVKREDYPGILLEALNSNGINVYSSQSFWPFYNLHEGGVRLTDNIQGDSISISPYTYRLYAADRDYTVTGLVASSTDATRKPAFKGLTNGQVIRKGESVEFSMVRPYLPNEAELWKGYVAILLKCSSIAFDNCRTDPEYLNEVDRLNKLYDAYKFTWSFGIAEKAGRTFYIGPAQ